MRVPSKEKELNNIFDLKMSSFKEKGSNNIFVLHVSNSSLHKMYHTPFLACFIMLCIHWMRPFFDRSLCILPIIIIIYTSLFKTHTRMYRKSIFSKGLLVFLFLVLQNNERWNKSHLNFIFMYYPVCAKLHCQTNLTIMHESPKAESYECLNISSHSAKK